MLAGGGCNWKPLTETSVWASRPAFTSTLPKCNNHSWFQMCVSSCFFKLLYLYQITINILFILTRSASIKSFRKTPDESFHLVKNMIVCQRTLAQVRIRCSALESCDHGLILAIIYSIIQRGELVDVQQIHFAPGSNENRHNSRAQIGGQVQSWPLITIQSVDVASCPDEWADDSGRALEPSSKVQGGHLGGK